LSDGKEQAGRGEGVDWDKVGLDDGHLVIDQADGEGVVNRGVDDPGDCQCESTWRKGIQ
jgi:hypothetical protein